MNKKKIVIFAKTIEFTFSFFFFKAKFKSFHNRGIKIFSEYWKKVVKNYGDYIFDE